MNNDFVSVTLPASHSYLQFITESFIQLIKSRVLLRDRESGFKYLSDSKILIHELYTNAINHSGSQTVTFNFSFEDSYIDIQMITQGPGFIVKPVDQKNRANKTQYLPPYPKKIHGTEFMVHSDMDYEVACRVKDENSLEFVKRKRAPEKDYEIPEHFGLLIITNLCSDVSFVSNRDGKNIFSLKRTTVT